MGYHMALLAFNKEKRKNTIHLEKCGQSVSIVLLRIAIALFSIGVGTLWYGKLTWT